MSLDIMQYWPIPNYQPRQVQKNVLKWISELPSTKKYIMCELAVGAGKSIMGVNTSAWLANSLGSSFILTPQKILQKQYQDTFDRNQLFSLYGKANYTCEPKNTNCDVGTDIKPRCATCPYRNAMSAMKTSPNIVLNYTLALLLFMIKDEISLAKRELIVFDECHTLEHHLTEFKALQIGEKRWRQFKIDPFHPQTELEALEWIKTTYLPAVKHEFHNLKSVVDAIMSRYEQDEVMDRVDAEQVAKLKELVNHIDTINYYASIKPEELVQKYALIKDKSYFKFKPLYGKDIFNQFVKPMANRFLFMSSTILNKDEFCRDLGIPPEEAAFISMDSEFPVENRPVFYIPTMKMTYGWDKPEKQKDRKMMIDRIIDICVRHNEDSGIIHSGSFKIASWLIEELQGKIPQRIMHHLPDSGNTRDSVIKEFTDNDGKEPMVLISPSITEGLDLKDDRARFNIIAKVPFPSLADAWVKKKQSLSKEWYTRQTMIGIIQGTGRTTRSVEDFSYCYILDSSFGMLRNMYSKHIPKWFSDSLM